MRGQLLKIALSAAGCASERPTWLLRRPLPRRRTSHEFADSRADILPRAFTAASTDSVARPAQSPLGQGDRGSAARRGPGIHEPDRAARSRSGGARPDRRRARLQHERPGSRAADPPGSRQGQRRAAAPRTDRGDHAPRGPRRVPPGRSGPHLQALPARARPRHRSGNGQNLRGGCRRLSEADARWVRKSSFRDGSTTRSLCSKSKGMRSRESRRSSASHPGRPETLPACHHPLAPSLSS